MTEEALPAALQRRIAENLNRMCRDGTTWLEAITDDLRVAPLRRESTLDGPPNPAAPTEPELMVLRCVSRGLTVKEAAEALGKGYETVKTQAVTVRVKLSAKTVAHAACEAIRRGLIP